MDGISGWGLLILLAWWAIGKAAATGVWEGHISFGNGEGNFHPCKSRETWWIKSQGYTRTAEELYTRYTEVAQQPYERVYARVRGLASKKGQYGHLGSYQRVVYVEEILEVRQAQSEDCK
ncbi:MAG: hypothetical protein JXA33_00605 [Anaerolineae bacterium]|nr:hypothetical protein [Anaerolineae bacterium]